MTDDVNKLYKTTVCSWDCVEFYTHNTKNVVPHWTFLSINKRDISCEPTDTSGVRSPEQNVLGLPLP